MHREALHVTLRMLAAAALLLGAATPSAAAATGEVPGAVRAGANLLRQVERAGDAAWIEGTLAASAKDGRSWQECRQLWRTVPTDPKSAKYNVECTPYTTDPLPPGTVMCPLTEGVCNCRTISEDGEGGIDTGPWHDVDVPAGEACPITPPPPWLPLCVPVPRQDTVMTRGSMALPSGLTGQVARVQQAMDWAEKKLGIGDQCKPYFTVRPFFSSTASTLGCCEDTYGAPTMYTEHRDSAGLQLEAGVMCTYPIPLVEAFGVLGAGQMGIPPMIVRPVLQNMDKWLNDRGGGCFFRAFGEGGGSGSEEQLTGRAPCDHDCEWNLRFTGYVLGGAGLQCALPSFAPLPDPITGSSKPLPRWFQVDGQMWLKVSPIGVQFDCNGMDFKKPSLQFCAQWRLRFRDWIDLEQQACRKVWDPLNGGAKPNDGGMGLGV